MKCNCIDASSEDIDLHRFKCTKCGTIGYYSGRAEEAYEKGVDPDNFIRDTTARHKERQPTGDFTGRCHKCGSNDLWDDNLTYGCNKCGMIRFGG